MLDESEEAEVESGLLCELLLRELESVPSSAHVGREVQQHHRRLVTGQEAATVIRRCLTKQVSNDTGYEKLRSFLGGVNSVTAEKNVDGEKLLAAIERIAISEKDARALVASMRAKAGRQREGEPQADYEARTAEALADRIVGRYSRIAATSGGLTALPGVIPLLGTPFAVGGAFGDALFCMKLQIDMVMCLAVAFGHDLGNEETRHLAFIIGTGGALEHAGEKAATQFASKAAVRVVKQYLKGATLQVIKEMFKKLGISFTRKALERGVPFGVGVVLGAGGNYALTRYVGKTARDWFVHEREERVR